MVLHIQTLAGIRLVYISILKILHNFNINPEATMVINKESLENHRNQFFSLVMIVSASFCQLVSSLNMLPLMTGFKIVHF